MRGIKSFTLLNNFAKGKIAACPVKFVLQPFNRIKQHLTGFTLVELLVVVIIITILAVTAIPHTFRVIRRARDAALKSDMKEIQAIAAMMRLEGRGLSTVHCNPGRDFHVGVICDKIRDNSPGPVTSDADARGFTISAPLSDGRIWSADSTGFVGVREPVDGWVWVPGSSLYRTLPGFWVMQFEAKYDGALPRDRIGDDANWAWATARLTGDATANLPANVVSTPQGRPIAHITHDEARTACEGMGGGARLITNSQWMTIARNAETQAINWGGGLIPSLVVASTVPAAGGLRRGNVGIVDSASANEADPASGPIAGRDIRSRLTLSNGSEIWDISGNVWEYTFFDGGNNNGLVSEADQPDNPAVAAGWIWSEFTAVNDGSGEFNAAVFRPTDHTRNHTHGVGRIWHHNLATGTAENRVFIRGGHWADGAYAGAFSLHLHPTAGCQFWHIGFRCAR